MDKIIIYTDGACSNNQSSVNFAYIVNCINNKWYINWRKNGWKTAKKTPVENRELWERLLSLIENLENFEIIKVKGHAGDKYNEMADELARRGANEVK